jgi:hypothetical protein
MGMSTHEFMLFLTIGAAALAAWVVVRFPGITPHSGRAVTVWLFATIACFIGAPFAVTGVGMELGAFIAVFCVALPMGICIFLTTAWVMLYVMRAIAPYRG